MRSLQLRFAIGFLLALGLACCSTPKKVTLGPEPSTGAPLETFGPPKPAETPLYGPTPELKKPVVLVFGPGLARGFAYVGVLRALHEARIPIAAILTTELGSLIGAMYATDADINRFEWALQGFKEEVFLEKGSLINRLLEKPSDGKKLSEELEKVLGNKDLSGMKIPLQVGLQSESANEPTILNQGKVVAAIRAAMAVPGFLTVSDWNGTPAMAANSSRPYLVSEARALNLGPVIAVNVLSTPDQSKSRVIEVQMKAAENLGANDLRSADLVLRPDMKGIGYLDFAKRNDAAFRGKASVQNRIGDIKKLLESQ